MYSAFNFTNPKDFIDRFSKTFIGADDFANKLEKTIRGLSNVAISSYPPFNLKKTSDNTYVIEMAVAGFGKQDIELVLEDNKLKISGEVSSSTDENDKFLYKGISDRAFTREFSIADNVVINNAHLSNGLLKIWLESIIPQDKKPKKIDINFGENDTPKSAEKDTPKSARSGILKE